MSKVIWKYPLAVTDRQQVEMPQDYDILHVGVQDGRICLWAMVNPVDELTQQVTILVVGTGNPMPEKWDHHLGTVHLGPFVWHVFEVWDTGGRAVSCDDE